MIQNSEMNESLFIDVALLGFFAIPHTLFARAPVKKFVSKTFAGSDSEVCWYRSMYVLQATFALHLLMMFWRPIYADVVV